MNYYAHKNIPLFELLEQLCHGAGIRDLGRHYGVSAAVITNRITRLARQFIVMTAKLRKDHFLQEDLVTDGFESFTVSQFFPNNYHLIIGKDSQFFYGVDYAHLRRKGRMTDAQKEKRAELEEIFMAPSNDVYTSFKRLCETISHLKKETEGQKTLLFSDEKREYKKVIKNLKRDAVPGDCILDIEHQTISSRLARTLQNRLFAVNYFDREIRKDQANHVRETVEWSRNTNGAVERMYVYGSFHNFIKKYRIKPGEDRCHAEVAGFPKDKIDQFLRKIFTRRLFLGNAKLTLSEKMIWKRSYKTPLLKKEGSSSCFYPA